MGWCLASSWLDGFSPPWLQREKWPTLQLSNPQIRGQPGCMQSRWPINSTEQNNPGVRLTRRTEMGLPLRYYYKSVKSVLLHAICANYYHTVLFTIHQTRRSLCQIKCIKISRCLVFLNSYKNNLIWKNLFLGIFGLNMMSYSNIHVPVANYSTYSRTQRNR